MIYMGNFAANSTIYFAFDTYGSSGESITMTGLAVTDVEVYRNGSTTQRASDNGYTLLDTDGIDFDGVTGLHGFSIDLSDNSDSGFYAAGSTYWVNVNAITVNSQTVRFTFYFTIGVLPANVTQWLGTACSTPTVAGVPEVDVTHINGQSGGDYGALSYSSGSGYLTARLVDGSSGDGLTVSGGTFTGNIERINGNAAIALSGGTSTIFADSVTGEQGILLSGTTAVATVHVRQIKTTSISAVGCSAGSGGKLTVYADSLLSLDNGEVVIDILANHDVTIVARYISGVTEQTAGRLVIRDAFIDGNVDEAGGTMILENCVIANPITCASGTLYLLRCVCLSTVTQSSTGTLYADATTRIIGAVTGTVTRLAAYANNDAGEAIPSANKVADTTLRRTMASVESSSDGEAVSVGSLYGLVQQAQESSRTGTTLTVKKTDGTTTLGTKTIATNSSADPITGIS